MSEQLTFRRFTGEQVTHDVVSYGAAEAARNYLLARTVRFGGDLELRQHRPVSGPARHEGYERLDNEILAGRQLHELADWSYPTQVAMLYGDEATSAEPFALFEPYQGQPLSRVGQYMGDDEFDAFVTGLLTGLCWLAAAGIAHQMISPDTVFWDAGRGVLITDLSRSTIFGVPRAELKGYDGWLPRELRSGSRTGMVGPRDDIWAAGRLIFFVRNQGEEPRDRSQLADLDAMFSGMFDRVLGPADGRPTARELLENGLRQRVNVPSATRRGDRLKDGRAAFLRVRERKHPGAAVPPHFNADLDWMSTQAARHAAVNGDHTVNAAAAPADAAAASSAGPPGGTTRFRRRRGGL